MSHSRYPLEEQTPTARFGHGKLLYLSTAKYGGDWHSVPHTHAFGELFYVVKGVGRFRIENEFYPVEAGDLVIVSPDVEHTETSLDAKPMEYIVLGVEKLELSGGGGDARFRIVHFQGRQEEIQMYLRTMLREMETKQPGYEIICRNLLDVIFVRLMRRTDFQGLSSDSRQNHGRVSGAVRRYIDLHYKEALTLDELSRAAHVSKYHVVHTFTKEYGISPMNYLTAKRIEEGKQLLATTDYPLSRVAQMLGFSSGSYFSQCFRKAEGSSPMEYRRAHR